MATIIFDFDHTLFDTKSFKNHIDSLIKKSGTPDEIAKTAEKNFREINFNNYDFVGHLDEIRNLGVDLNDGLYKSLENEDLSKYKKEGIEETINKLKSNNHRLILLTKGIIDFQNLKLKQSGIGELFGTNIIICDKEKEKVIERMSPDPKNTFFINDNVEETDTVENYFPEINFIIVKRPDLDYKDISINPKYKVVDRIEDILKII